MTRRTPLLSSATLLALLLCACGESAQGQSTDAAAADAAATDAAIADADVTAASGAKPPQDPQDPCRLLEPAEVEAVLGAPLGGAPFRSGNPDGDSAGIGDPTGASCWYETADFRNLAVQATWTDAGALMAAMGGYLAKADEAMQGLVKLQDGSELTGDWDEVRMLGCCNFVAVRGDSMVEIDFGGSAASPEQAGALASAALARMDAPLPIDGSAGVAAAAERRRQRPAVADFCALWSPDDIAAVLGELQDKPQLSDNTCTYVYSDGNGRRKMFMSIAVLRNGARRYRGDNRISDTLIANVRAEHGQRALKDAAALDGPWDEAAKTPIQFNTRKGDIQIAIRHSGMRDDELRTLIARAYATLGIDPGDAP